MMGGTIIFAEETPHDLSETYPITVHQTRYLTNIRVIRRICKSDGCMSWTTILWAMLL